MLDGEFEHIVFVHYREVNEGCRSETFHLLPDPGSQSVSLQTASAPDYPSADSPDQPVYGSLSCTASIEPEVAGFPESNFNHGTLSVPCFWPGIHNLATDTVSTPDQKLYVEQPGTADFITHREAQLRVHDISDTVTCADKLINNVGMLKIYRLIVDLLQELQRRRMYKEIGDCDDSLMASDSANYWNTLNTETDDKEVSSLSRHMQLDIDSLGPTLSQEQLFSIVYFSPDWAYSSVETKALLVGNFLRNKELSGAAKWGCTFGEIEVSAEVLTNNVIRCQVPSHASGRVPLYITCSNRLACSETREFEYRRKLPGFSFITGVKTTEQEEIHLQVRLAKSLHVGPRRKREGLILNLLKQKLRECLINKVHEDGKGPHILDDKGQGIIHLVASLGYEWAMDPIASAGISPNFRDARGRSTLHWASYFGREETVIALIKLGTSPGAIDDPKPNFPGGRTATDLASSRGHKGIVGYRAEADLITRLSSLTVNQNSVDNDATTMAAQEAVETASQVAPSNGALDENCALKGSLTAVRKSDHAAALIQSAFRARFSHLQSTTGNDDV
ncbi:Calmodulin-binding transcription activator protein with CG-1 and Ankyrin domains, putative isoform 2 [Hibiscus syriacus]|uniref:Calmodulin-binding transcription activator protein with CG-1 and Ankyrin domains, putative isoform 2 n=1 Tax=Hibiscus syriacus TaxID=106335 RepID=A0A6A3C2N6_HIBSY|nr:Calmodulin-binding transcription activator protein with CG-1 and Ankyrin domains, putative isoform 2 [Hibiscus syriacus]